MYILQKKNNNKKLADSKLWTKTTFGIFGN